MKYGRKTMIKTLILGVGAVSIFIFTLDFQLENQEDKQITSSLQKENNPPTQPQKKPKVVNKSEESIPNKASKEREYNLESQMVLLLDNALEAKNQGDFQKSLELLNQIIDTLQDQHSLALERLYAQASFSKALLFRFQLNNPYDAIQTYQTIQQRFKKRQELPLLLYYAKAGFDQAQMENKERSIEIYNDIIQTFQSSQEIELLKKFAQASFEKSYLSSSDEAIEIYDTIIQRFQKSDNPELLEDLYNAQMNKAYVLEHYQNEIEETIEVYDEIIDKFSNYSESSAEEKVENALFSKSFLLMGDSYEEAMENFDKIIDKYRNELDEGSIKTPPQKMVFSLVNNIEISLISNNDDTEYQELAQEYFSEDSSSHTEIEMLNILKNAQEEDQSEAIQAWEEKHKDFQFENWSFDKLEEWNAQMEESEIKTRIRDYLDRFIKHYDSPSNVKENKIETTP